MKIKTIFWLIIMLAPSLAGMADRIRIPGGIDHTDFDRLLKTYVDDQGLVDYERWKNSPEDLAALDSYLSAYAPKPETEAAGNERWAGLINAYNAFTLQWILKNYPTESIRLLDESWPAKRHRIGGKLHSLDEIEHDNLRPEMGWRVHSAIVCAARSCPPLQTFAFSAEMIDAQTETALRTWLARTDLNTFSPSRKRVEVSQIFNWFEEDFTKDGGVGEILSRYAPRPYRLFLKDGSYKLKFKDYHWGLNDQGDLGKDYKQSLFRSLL